MGTTVGIRSPPSNPYKIRGTGFGVGEIFNLVSVSRMNQRRVEGHLSMTFRQSSRVGTG